MGMTIDKILYSLHRDEVHREDDWFSTYSNVEVWEAGPTASKRRTMNDGEFVQYLKDGTTFLPEEAKFRAIFIPDTKEDTDRLQLTRPAFELLLDAYHVSARFPGIIGLQMQPSRQIEYDPQHLQPTSIQYLYSAIVRSLASAANPNDPTKRVLDWRRLCVWTRCDLRRGATTLILLRCPADARARLAALLDDHHSGRRELLRCPMLVHACLAEHLVRRSTTFSEDFAAPLYGLELRLGRTAAELTARARTFMTMARQIGNVLVDYDVYLASLALLQEVYAWIREQDPPDGVSAHDWRAAHLVFDGRSFQTVRQEFELLQRYGRLYMERTTIGNSESDALVNQHDAELNKAMAAESTFIARSAQREGQSLRVIQYLGLFFLPLSLCTSIFGMGFFGTSPNADNTGTAFLIADAWWWFLALALPFTALTLAITLGSAWWSAKKVEKRRGSEIGDLELLYSKEQ